MAKIVFIAEVQAFIDALPNRAARKRVESHFNNVLKRNSSRSAQLLQLDEVKTEIASRRDKKTIPSHNSEPELATRQELT